MRLLNSVNEASFPLAGLFGNEKIKAVGSAWVESFKLLLASIACLFMAVWNYSAAIITFVMEFVGSIILCPFPEMRFKWQNFCHNAARRNMEQEQRIAEGGQQIFNNVDILDNSSENPFCFNNEWIIDGADYLRAFFKAFGYGSIGLILSSIVVLPIVGLLALCSPLILVALVVWGISKLFKKEVQEETEEDKEFNKDYMVKIMAVLCVLTVGLLIAFGTIPGITLTTWQWIAVAGIVSFMANGILNRKALAQTATGATDEICSTLRRKDSDIWFAAEEEKAAEQHEDNTSTVEVSPDDVPSEEVDVEDILATTPEQPTVVPTASDIVEEVITETIRADKKAVLLTRKALMRKKIDELREIAESYDIDTDGKVKRELAQEILERQEVESNN